MSENPIHFSNTPIFDQLVAELAARGKRYENLVANPPEHLKRRKNGYTPQGVYVDEATPKQNARLEVNAHPLDAEKSCGSWARFMQDRIDEFNRKYPHVMNVTVSTQEELDGTVTVVIEGVEVSGVKLAKKPAWGALMDEQESGGETFHIRGEITTLPPVFRTKSKRPEEWADAAMGWVHQMYGDFVEAHPNAVITDTEVDATGALVIHAVEPKQDSTTETQTDETVNAALNDEIHPQYAAPRPLWDISKDDADEE